MKLLLKNAHVISNAKTETLYKNAYIGIEDDTIIYVGIERPVDSYDEEKDMSGKLIFPGLVNAHTHNPMTLVRGIGSDLPLLEWLDIVMPIEDSFTAEDNMTGSRLAWMEMLASGITSCSDMYEYPECTIEDIQRMGVKINMGRGVLSFDENEAALDNPRVLETIELFKKYDGRANGRIKVDFAIHAEYTCKEKTVREFSKICKDHGTRMHVHISESPKEHADCIERYGKTPTQWFYDLGLFENPVFGAHCVQLTKEDMDIFKKAGATVVHNPTSNLKLASGIAPIQTYLDMGINVALGTDGAASNNNLNMIEEMHIASIVHKGYNHKPNIISPAQVLTMATINGATMQGRLDTGSIEVGKKADMAAIDLQKAHLQPHTDLFSTLVYAAQGSDVCMTMVDGKILYENGEYTTIDKEKTLFEFNKSCERLLKDI